MIEYKEDSYNKTIIIELMDVVNDKDVKFLIFHLQRRLSDWNELKIVNKINKNFRYIEFSSFASLFYFYFKYLKYIKKYSIVGNGYKDLIIYYPIGTLITMPLICQFKYADITHLDSIKKWMEIKHEEVKEHSE